MKGVEGMISVIVGYCISMIGIIMMSITFFVAYFFTVDKQVLVTINNYGEANLELLLVVVSLFLSIYGLIQLVRIEYKKNMELKR